MQAIVDRIEDNDIAVLEIDGTRHENVPLTDLPAGTRQGDVLAGKPGAWHKDDAARREREQDVDALKSKLFRKH